MELDDNLQALLDLLSLSSDDQGSLEYEKQKIQSKLDLIFNHFQQTYPQAIIVQEKIGEQEFQFSLPLEIHGGMCRTIVVIQINFKKCKLGIDVQFAEEYGRMQVQQKMLRLQLGRYMLKVNNNLRVGSFYINPQHGYVGLNLMCLQDKQYKENVLQEETYSEKLFPYLDSLLYTALHSMKFHFVRILFLMNKIKIKELPLYEKYMEEQKKVTQCRKIPEEGEDLLVRIKAMIKKDMHKPITQEEYKKYEYIFKKTVQTDKKCLVQIEPSEPKEIENLLKKINEGDFCNIYSKDLYYKTVKDGYQGGSNAKKRTFVIKKEKDVNGQRVQRERQILLTLANSHNQMYGIGDQYIKKNGCCPHIAQFYYVNDKKDTLLMEKYFHTSLNYFKVKQYEVMSLSTKLYIAQNIAMGLRYIHSYKIVHMDIKPTNILVSNKLEAKITGFGEAINLEFKDNYKSGKTFPFAAPEILQGKEITTAYDTFAFGTLLFELIFDRYPIDFNRTNHSNLEERMSKSNYFVRYDEEYGKTIGPQVIVKYLARMCIQCLQPEPEKRPNIDKICLVLKYCQIYLDKVY